MEPGRGLLAVAREKMRTRHLAYRTEQSYLYWIRGYVAFHHRRHPRELGAPGVEQFLTHLAVNRKVGASTQNQALQALLFLYRQVLGLDTCRGWKMSPGRRVAGGCRWFWGNRKSDRFWLLSRAPRACWCQVHSHASTAASPPNGAGSIFFRRGISAAIRIQASGFVTISMSRPCNGP